VKLAALFGLGSDEISLANPEWLWWLLPFVAISIAIRVRNRPAALGWPSLAAARSAGARRVDWVRGASIALRAFAAIALAMVLARPVGVHRAPPEPGFGLDLVLVVDASGSMRSVDTQVDGQRTPRIELARRAVARFAETRVAAGDRVALVVFGESAFTPCPLTSDSALLLAALARVEAGVAGEATALGEALALAVRRVIAGRPTVAPGGPIDGHAIVLLTDGRNNAGALSLDVATAIARDEGVRVHTVAIGTRGTETPMARGKTASVRSLRFERHDVDSKALAAVAAATGGRFFAARRSDELAAVYREIDALERVARRLPPRIRHSQRPEATLALAGVFLIAEVAIARVFGRRLP
jgi:Ca-activated chloride channel family protein